MWTFIAVLTSLALVVVMSGRDAKDLPRSRSPREVLDAVRNTHWLRSVLLALRFVVAFSVHLGEGLLRTAWLALGLGVKLVAWSASGLIGLAALALEN